MGVSDLVARFPLSHIVLASVAKVIKKGCRRAYVCFLCSAASVVLIPLYWLNLALTSLSMFCSSFCKFPISSPNGRSARYLDLSHWKLRK